MNKDLPLLRRFILGVRCGGLGGSVGGGLYGLSLAIVTLLYKGGADLGDILFAIGFLTIYGIGFGLIGGIIIGAVLGVVAGTPTVIKRRWVLIPISLLGSVAGITLLLSVLAWPPLWPTSLLQVLDAIILLVAGGIGGATGGRCYIKRALHHLLRE